MSERLGMPSSHFSSLPILPLSHQQPLRVSHRHSMSPLSRSLSLSQFFFLSLTLPHSLFFLSLSLSLSLSSLLFFLPPSLFSSLSPFLSLFFSLSHSLSLSLSLPHSLSLSLSLSL